MVFISDLECFKLEEHKNNQECYVDFPLENNVDYILESVHEFGQVVLRDLL